VHFKRKSKDEKSKKVLLSEQVSSILKYDTPPKFQDPGIPTISCYIGNHKIERALLDLSSSVNLIPYSVYLELELGELEPSNCTLQLADKSIRTLRVRIDDVLMQIDKGFFHVDFVVLDMNPSHASKQIPLILGRPFLATANATINCRSGVMDFSVMNMRVRLNIFKGSIQPVFEDESECFFVDVIDEMIKEALPAILASDPLETCLSRGDLRLCDLGSAIDEMDYSLDFTPYLESSSCVSTYEPLPPLASSPIPPSVVSPPKLELKPLPDSLKYVFLGPKETLPVIISSLLSFHQEEELIRVLSDHKSAIEWLVADLKGIGPTICMHRIHLEDDAKPVRQMQHRLSPHTKEVVQKEVVKLLDADIIYPISDSQWVSPIQVVPKKSGITVVKNNERELIPTRQTTGWRVCIDYRKLNSVTRKDHFSIPFIHQILKKLDEQSFYCFLDGYAGYNQISVYPEDQEKTTFICQSGIFAYRMMPFGLCNAPSTFQRCMMAIFTDYIDNFMDVFMDDFSVFGSSFDVCLANLSTVLKRCEEVNLVLS